ncbi:GDP-mannose transporter [Pancytospora epiphaga]|nr:GDP-mannose transporter [Pancytospora epiphaga]
MNKLSHGISALLLYFISSVVAIMLNKVIMSTFAFKMHYFLTFIQSVSIVAFLAVYYASVQQKPKIGGISRWWLASGLLTIMIFTNMKTVYYFPVTLFTLLKNLSVVFTALLELRLFGRRISPSGYIGLGLIILSSYSGSISDPGKLIGYGWMGTNIIFSVAYVLYLRKLMIVDNVPRLTTVLCTNLLSIPILGIMSWFLDPWTPIPVDSKLCALILASSICAFLTALSTACTLKSLCSTTFCMVGALNKLLLVLGGLVFLKEDSGLLKLFSIFVGIFASMFYTLDSLKRVTEASSSLELETLKTLTEPSSDFCELEKSVHSSTTINVSAKCNYSV